MSDKKESTLKTILMAIPRLLWVCLWLVFRFDVKDKDDKK